MVRGAFFFWEREGHFPSQGLQSYSSNKSCTSVTLLSSTLLGSSSALVEPAKSDDRKKKVGDLDFHHDLISVVMNLNYQRNESSQQGQSQVSSFVRSTATTFAPRSSTAVRNPAFKGVLSVKFLTGHVQGCKLWMHKSRLSLKHMG